MSWKKRAQLMDTIRHYASFPATGVSLQQMVQFGEKPSTGESCNQGRGGIHGNPSGNGPRAYVSPLSIESIGIRMFGSILTRNASSSPGWIGTLFRASQFLAEELPIRLAHRVQDLQELPDGLSDMPSVIKVQDWYAQSFEVSARPDAVRLVVIGGEA
jgi:pyruvate dehydrogenase kinase 2/3/4